MSDIRKGKFLNHDSARTEVQKELMDQIEKDGVCPFCAEYFKKYHPKPILKETDYWFVTENMEPYAGTIQHFIFVYKPSHITLPTDMTPEASADFFECVSWCIETYKIKGGSFFMRFGDTSYNKSSVKHLHAQLLTGVSNTESSEKIKTTLGWKKPA